MYEGYARDRALRTSFFTYANYELKTLEVLLP